MWIRLSASRHVEGTRVGLYEDVKVSRHFQYAAHLKCIPHTDWEAAAGSRGALSACQSESVAISQVMMWMCVSLCEPDKVMRLQWVRSECYLKYKCWWRLKVLFVFLHLGNNLNWNDCVRCSIIADNVDSRSCPSPGGHSLYSEMINFPTAGIIQVD